MEVNIKKLDFDDLSLDLRVEIDYKIDENHNCGYDFYLGEILSVKNNNWPYYLNDNKKNQLKKEINNWIDRNSEILIQKSYEDIMNKRAGNYFEDR